MDDVATFDVGHLGAYLRDQRERAQLSLRQLSASTGVPGLYLSQIERGLRRPSAEVLQQIARGLRLSAETLYVQAGVLDEREGDQRVPVAVLADTAIDERQKQVLLDVYESFRRENAARAAAARAGDRDAHEGDPDGTGTVDGAASERPGPSSV